MNSRYYNPEWGRFINADAMVGKSGELLAHNMFAYCRNNPVNMDDPSGYLPKWLQGLSSVLVGVGEVMAGVSAFGAGPVGLVAGTLMIAHGIGNIVSGGTMIYNSLSGKSYDETSFIQRGYEYLGEKVGGERGKKVATAVYNTAEIAMATYGTMGGAKTILKGEHVPVVQKTIGTGFRQLGTFNKPPAFTKIVDYGMFGKYAITPNSMRIFSGAGIANDISQYGYWAAVPNTFNSWKSAFGR